MWAQSGGGQGPYSGRVASRTGKGGGNVCAPLPLLVDSATKGAEFGLEPTRCFENDVSSIKFCGVRNLNQTRVSRVLTMVDDTQNYWVFGLFQSTGILDNRVHDVSGTGSVSVFR
jgi:hypothetical protein